MPAVDVETRVLLESKLVMDVPGLAAGATAANALQRQLAADPRWRVVDWEGGRVAYQRVADGRGWTVPLRGYHSTAAAVWRTAVVLSPWAPSSVWVRSALVGRSPASRNSIRISQINYEGNPEWRAVAWGWGDPGATLEVFEAGPRAAIEALPHTSDALSAVPGLMSRVASVKAEIQSSGFAASLLSPMLMRAGEPEIAVHSPGPGELEVRAWVPTPGPGVSWARALDADARVWEEAAFAAGTREILGFGAAPVESQGRSLVSTHEAPSSPGERKPRSTRSTSGASPPSEARAPRQLFYMQGRFPAPAGPAFSGTVEIWHRPDGGGELRRLTVLPVTIPGR